MGEIAETTGLTVRALHQAIGLVETTERTVSGHRFYGPKSVDRLYRVSMLRAFGLPLECVFTVVTLIRNFPRMSNW
ncbi:MAG TPA: MerR family transcriptional regulator [Candidatus Yaniella excrementigallinarum]|nr:MerR family transcriptional regulator [Candidatus Yaniella excrementigallinarum]